MLQQNSSVFLMSSALLLSIVNQFQNIILTMVSNTRDVIISQMVLFCGLWAYN